MDEEDDGLAGLGGLAVFASATDDPHLTNPELLNDDEVSYAFLLLRGLLVARQSAKIRIPNGYGYTHNILSQEDHVTSKSI